MANNSFSLQVAKWAEKTKGDIDQNCRRITLKLFTQIITDTPVDTGRARGNWMTTVEAPAKGVVDRLDPDGTAAIAEVSANMGGAGKITYLTNNLPYIAKLEFGGYPDPVKRGSWIKRSRHSGEGHYEILSIGGYSKQSPAGMVRINLARFQEIVQAALK
jgi:hypothetical protein